MQMVGLGGRPGVYANVPQAIRHIFLTGAGRSHGGRATKTLLGLREFYRGLVPELIKVTPFNAIMFCTHNWLKGQGLRPERGPPPPLEEP
mmetsp:Transcript_24936/g.78302  ORF Transcript_24936/g.78302 Transcript_24936/m.78302 type:complete len:90 (+) Transcript_24936:1-270(+)